MDITADNIFTQKENGKILNLENKPSGDKFTFKLLECIFKIYGSYGTKIFLTSRTKSIVEYHEYNLEKNIVEMKRVKALLSFGDDWGVLIKPF
jgi:hypothetical protein